MSPVATLTSNVRKILCFFNSSDNLMIQQNVPNTTCLQCCAGSGKTYDSIQLLNTTPNISVFVYITKMNSAKNVVQQELEKQMSNKEGYVLTKVHPQNNQDTPKYYHYTLTSNNNIKTIIIATVDSYNYNAPRNQQQVRNSFSFYDEIARQINNNGRNFIFKGVPINPSTLIIVDEVQDLPEPYIEALRRIQQFTGSRLYCIGDQLQQLFQRNNVMDQQLRQFIRVGSRSVRRFENEESITFCNQFIDHNRFGLDDVEYDQEANRDIVHHHLNRVQTFFIGRNDMASNIERTSNHVMKIFADELNDNREYLPEDFMIISPFINNNALLQEIQIRIQDFWIIKLNQPNTRHVMIHHAEAGGSIDLSKSLDKTRIVSIHTSKGDGRNVVIVLGLDEQGIKVYSGQSDQQYESFLNVAITRHKRNLYIGYSSKDDDVHTRLQRTNAVDTNIGCDAQLRIQALQVDKFSSFIQNIYEGNGPHQQECQQIVDRLVEQYHHSVDNTLKPLTLDYIHHIIRNQCLKFLMYQITCRGDMWPKQMLAKLHQFKNRQIMQLGELAYRQQMFGFQNKQYDVNKKRIYKNSEYIYLLIQNQPIVNIIIKYITEVQQQFIRDSNIQSFFTYCSQNYLRIIVLMFCLHQEHGFGSQFSHQLMVEIFEGRDDDNLQQFYGQLTTKINIFKKQYNDTIPNQFRHNVDKRYIYKLGGQIQMSKQFDIFASSERNIIQYAVLTQYNELNFMKETLDLICSQYFLQQNDVRDIYNIIFSLDNTRMNVVLGNRVDVQGLQWLFEMYVRHIYERHHQIFGQLNDEQIRVAMLEDIPQYFRDAVNNAVGVGAQRRRAINDGLNDGLNNVLDWVRVPRDVPQDVPQGVPQAEPVEPEPPVDQYYSLTLDTETYCNDQLNQEEGQVHKNWSVIQVGWLVADRDNNVIKRCKYNVDHTNIQQQNAKNHRLWQVSQADQNRKSIDDIIGYVLNDLRNCEIIIGHNVQYDLNVLSNYYPGIRFVMSGDEVCMIDNSEYKIQDTQNIQIKKNIFISDIRGDSGNQHWLNLSRLAELLGIHFDSKQLHTAAYDVDITFRCYCRLQDYQ